MATATKTRKSTKPAALNSRQGVEEAIIQLQDEGAETVTTAQVQELAASLTPAVKDGYANFWLTKFNKSGRYVQRVKRGTYEIVYGTAKEAPAHAAAKVPAPAPEVAALDREIRQLDEMTRAELVIVAEENGIAVRKSWTKAQLISKLGDL